jgi:hypothetical protein
MNKIAILLPFLLLAGCAPTPPTVTTTTRTSQRAAAATPTPRDPAQRQAYVATHPCPVTGLTTGACPGYVVDHLYPLCAGGADIPDNMGWQEARASYVKDRIERELCACKKEQP